MRREAKRWDAGESGDVLHERTVAFLHDELTRRDVNIPEVRVRLAPRGDWSHDLRAGAKSVKVPGEWDSVGGIMPDLTLYGEDTSKPLRIIEVVVSNPPNKAKQENFDTLGRRGVDGVVVKVTTGKDLRDLCRMNEQHIFSFSARGVRDYPLHANGQHLRQQHKAQDQVVTTLIEESLYKQSFSAAHLYVVRCATF